MSKKWLLVIPAGVIAVLIAFQAAQSFGFKRHNRHAMAQEFMEWRLEKFSKELNLDETQKAKLDAFKNDIHGVFEERREKRKEIHALVKEELSKDNPDLARLRPMVDQQIDSLAQTAHGFVGRVEEFYNGLTPEQKKILRDKIVEKMEDHDHYE
jgi:Spy/CpxP family protein refolding chaperone